METQLAREMNVSQAPVREALLELAAMGLVEDLEHAIQQEEVEQEEAEKAAEESKGSEQ